MDVGSWGLSITLLDNKDVRECLVHASMCSLETEKQPCLHAISAKCKLKACEVLLQSSFTTWLLMLVCLSLHSWQLRWLSELLSLSQPSKNISQFYIITELMCLHAST